MKKFFSLSAFFFRSELPGASLWAGGIMLYNFISVYLFRSYSNQRSIVEVYNALPEIWRNILGREQIFLNTPEGWMATQFFAFLPIVLGMYAIVASSSLFSREFETRSIELLLVQPVGRGGIFCSKIAVVYANTALIIFANLLVTVLACRLPGIGGVDLKKIFLLYYASLALMAFLASLSVLAAVLSDNQKQSTGAFLGILTGLFLANSILVTLKALPGLQKLNPFYYFDCSRIISSLSVPAGGLLYWVAGSAALFLAAIIYFVKRDIA